MFNEAWRVMSRATVLRCWIKSTCLPQMHVDAAKNMISEITGANQELVDLTDFNSTSDSSNDSMIGNAVSDSTSEIISGALSQHKYLGYTISSLPELIDAVVSIETGDGLVTVLN